MCPGGLECVAAGESVFGSSMNIGLSVLIISEETCHGGCIEAVFGIFLRCS